MINTMTRFARERHCWRVVSWNIGPDRMIADLQKGSWRNSKKQAVADVADFSDKEHVVVQKVRLGITKILETEKIR